MWRYFRLPKPAEMDDLCAPERRSKLVQAQPEQAPPEAQDLDLEKATRRPEYFSAGGYAAAGSRTMPPRPADIRAPDSNGRLREWVQSEMARVGLPVWLCPKIVWLAAIAIKEGAAAAREVLNCDLSIEEDYHFAINAILTSIPPLV